LKIKGARQFLVFTDRGIGMLIEIGSSSKEGQAHVLSFCGNDGWNPSRANQAKAHLHCAAVTKAGISSGLPKRWWGP